MREEEIYEEFDADEVRRDIKDGLEGHVDDVVDYIMAECDDNEFCGVYGSFSNGSEVAECVFELFGCEVDRDAALQYTLSDAIDWRKGSEELTPEILDSIRSEFSVIMEYLYQRYDGDAVIRDYRC